MGIKARNTNRLIKEKSPYLLQHANNPVDWYPWGEEAFRKAENVRKLIFLSIGYSTCHWCHVMEKESFEDSEIAEILNSHYISIKADREEHYDIDKIYMDFVIVLRGKGGWPLNVFLTPDLKPIYGGTYFRKEELKRLLKRINYIWENDPERLVNSVARIIYEIRVSEETEENEKGGPGKNILRAAYSQLESTFDKEYGGFGFAPKFPPSMSLDFLMRIYSRTGHEKALHIVEKTLRNMAGGGIYDHLGGGFHRYSTDEKWIVPHFEKMLYDNANLSWTYLEAYQITGNEEYSNVAREIFDYVMREMTDRYGGFYTAEDADSEGIEGKFYTWDIKELSEILSGEELELFTSIFKVTDLGNFENKNIFSLKEGYSLNEKYSEPIQKIKQKLLKVRNKRFRPLKDDKILTGWNGLMIASMAKAYQVLGDRRCLLTAQRAARFIRYNLSEDGNLMRRYRDGETKYKGKLDDYAYFIKGLLALYEADFNEEWIEWALELQDAQDRFFWDPDEGGYFYSPFDQENIIYRKKDFYDRALPNPNAVSASNLLKLSHITLNKELENKAETIIKIAWQKMKDSSYGYSSMLSIIDFYLDSVREIVVVKGENEKEFAEIINLLNKSYLPNKILLVKDGRNKLSLEILKGKDTDKNTLVYICGNNICRYPSSSPEEIKKQIEEKDYYDITE